MIRVLLIDDHPVVRTGYKRLLLQEPGIEVVAEAANADEGYQAFQLHLPDVTVTDVSMPGPGGLSLLEKMPQEIRYRPEFSTRAAGRTACKTPLAGSGEVTANSQFGLTVSDGPLAIASLALSLP